MEEKMSDCTYDDNFYCEFRDNNDTEPTTGDCQACAIMQIVDFLVYVVGPYFHNSDPAGDEKEANKTLKVRTSSAQFD